jgi:hypothetical protein
MNEIDQILSNIDKDDDANLFPEANADGKKNEEIIQLIDSIDDSTAAHPHPKDSSASGVMETETAGSTEAHETHEVHEAESRQEKEVEALSAAGIYTVRGTKSWNRREPYIINLDMNGLKNDVESLHKSFYFVEAPTDNETLKLKVKQEIVTFLRRPADHITERYSDFIYKNIITAIQEMTKNFKLDQNIDTLFIYHTGPMTMSRYIRDRFHNEKYGYCYKYLPGNKAARFFPDEFIKEIVLKWFEENINTLSLTYDSIQKYEEMKKLVSVKYHQDLRVFNGRLEQLNEKLGADKTISRSKLFQLKGISWFGQLNVEIYRRFLGNGVFM